MSVPAFSAVHALAVAGGALVLDQASKWAVLTWLEPGRPVELLPFFSLVLVWNRGVSFGLLAGLGAIAPWLLVLLALVVGAFLIWWFRREPAPLPRFAIALVLGGALGNVVDRLRFGAVVDFLDFHVRGWHWPAFNLADTAVVCGSALLVLESFLPRAHLLGTGGKEGS